MVDGGWDGWWDGWWDEMVDWKDDHHIFIIFRTWRGRRINQITSSDRMMIDNRNGRWNYGKF